MKRRRVKITGIGLVTPAGIGKSDFLKNIQEPVSHVSRLTRFLAEAGSFIGAEVKDFNLNQYAGGLNPKRVPRHTQLAAAATMLALKDAGITIPEMQASSVLIMIGATLMDFGVINKGLDMIARHGPMSALPTSVNDALVSGIGATVSGMLGTKTRVISPQSACCSGLDAIGRAAEMISTGETEIAICGGTEAPLHFHPMLELRIAGLSPGNPFSPEKQSRPFDRWRTTGVIGEGSCILILEPEGVERSAYAFVEGHGYASDIHGEPCTGLQEAMRLAVANGGLRPKDVDVISAWGPGHRVLDASEAREIGIFLGQHLENVAVTSIKGAIGNPLGAAGAIQVGCAALGIRYGIVPPTVNWEHPDPACQLNLSSKTRQLLHENTLVNAHGLSGTNTCLLLTR